MKNYVNILIFSVIFVVTCTLDGVINIQDVQGYAQRSTTTSKGYVFKMYNSSSDIRLITSGAVNIPHVINMTKGGYNVCKNEEVDFAYSNYLTFSAGNGFWDTPYGRWCSSVNTLCTSIWNGQRIYDSSDINWWMGKPHTVSDTAWYNAGLAEDRFKEARIMWTAVKPGSYMISSNPNVIRCSGMDCIAVGDGSATITAYAQKTLARIWAYVEFADGWKWRSEDMPYLNNKKTNKMWISNKDARVGSWNITVGSAARCNYCGDKKITSSEACDTTAGSTPVNTCTAGYNSMCEYCVSPGRVNQCTWQTVVGPYCGDGVVNGTEQCDAGANNGSLCVAPYDGTCQYCSNSCTNTTATGPYCGDGIKNGTEQCDGTDGVTNGNECTASCTLNYIAECGSKEGVSSDVKPANPNLCALTCDVSESPYLLQNGQWQWQCRQPRDPADPKTINCNAPSCLSGMPVEFQRYVYFDSSGNPQNASVSVSCPGVCCTIGGTAAGDYVVCNGDTNSEIEVLAGNNTYPTECWFDDDGERDDDETVVDVPDVSVGTMCTSRECNAQGTCQATPSVSADSNGCSSTCNSNADCTTGRIIETRP